MRYSEFWFPNYKFSEKEKDLLACLGVNAEGVKNIQHDVKEWSGRVLIGWDKVWTAIGVICALVASAGTAKAFGNPGQTSPTLITIIAVGWSIYVGVIVYVRSTPSPVRHAQAFRCAFAAADKIDKALGTPAMSKRRIAVDRRIMECSKQVRAFGPALSMTMHSKIAKYYAGRASLTVRTLIYPTLLGDDEQLEMVRLALVGIALKIGRAKWVEIGKN